MRTFYLIMSTIAIFASSIVFGADPKRPKDLNPITAAALNSSARWLVDGDFGTKSMAIDELKKSLNVFTSSTLTISNLTLSGAGTGILFSASGNVNVTSAYVASLAGTTNQVSVSSSTGAITISLPQNIHTAATPTFAGMTLSGLSDGYLKSTTGLLSTTTNIVTTLIGTANQVSVSTPTGSITLSLPQDIHTGASPTFAGVTLGTLTGVLKASSGVVSGSATTSDLPQGSNLYYTDAAARAAISAGAGITYSNGTGVIVNSGVLSLTGTALQITASASTGTISLSLPQNISTTSSPTFNLLKVSEIIDGQGSPVTSINPIDRRLYDTADRQSMDWSNRTLNGTTNNILDWNDQFRINGTQQAFNLTVGTVGAAEFLYLDATANALGVGGNTAPTALIHLGAGTTTAGTSPLKFTSGPLMTAPESGSVEFLTDAFYGTITTGTARKAFIMGDPSLTSGRIPFATTNGRVTDTSALTWGGTTLTIGGTVNATSGVFGGLTVNGSSTLNGALTLTGSINLATGSTSQVPITFNSASALTTTPAAGYFEFASDKYYGTITTGTARKELSLNDQALTAGRIPFATTNGRFTDSSNMTYTGNVFTLTGAGGGISMGAGGPSRMWTDGSTIAIARGGVGGPCLILDSNGGYMFATSVSASSLPFQVANSAVTADSSFAIGWRASDAGGTADTGFRRAAAGVITTTQSSWIQNTPGRLTVTTNATNATATMANLGGLTATLKAGRRYSGKMVLYCVDSVAAEGIAVDFDGGTATMTSFRAHATITDTALLSSTQATAIATDYAVATMTGDSIVEIRFSFVCNAAGTFIPRFAQNTHSTGTATVYALSYMDLEDRP